MYQKKTKNNLNKVCQKCGRRMLLMDGGYSVHAIRGEYDEREFPDYWFCKHCGNWKEEIENE